MLRFAFPSECLQLVYNLPVFCLLFLLHWKKPEMNVLVVFVLSEYNYSLCLYLFLLGISWRGSFRPDAVCEHHSFLQCHLRPQSWTQPWGILQQTPWMEV